MLRITAGERGAVWRRRAGALGLLIACLGVWPVASAGAAVATQAFTQTGAHSFDVPAGVHKLTVKAIGGRGGAGCLDSSGVAGAGSLVIATVPVTPEQQLSVYVAGVGSHCPDGAGGFGGGGEGGPVHEGGGGRGGGGGGASVVSETPWDPGAPGSAPLVVAGGGGGAGAERHCCQEIDGRPGTPSAGGRGGAEVAAGVVPGHDGSFGIGGAGATSNACEGLQFGGGDVAGGGGGGGGYYGGGGGAACLTGGLDSGNGGLGSSFVSAAGTTELGPVEDRAEPVVRLIYPVPVVELSARSVTFGQQEVGTIGKPHTIRITNRGSAPLVISRDEVDGDARQAFVLDDRCQRPVKRDSSCHVGVRFAPGKTGRRTATLRLVTNGAQAHVAVRLAGAGERVSHRRGQR